MTKYKFDEIAINSTQKKKPTEEDKVYYIGLEHIDPGCFDVVRWGSNVAPTGDKLLMQKGDVLFGKRRAYQRKVAIAPFDGIFSAHGMVLRPNLKVIDANYFPFFISSDKFMETAVRISVGGLSPTINWKDLARQEFELPSLDEQKVLADKLWAAYRLKEAYKKLLVATDEMVKSQFIEMFENVESYCKLEDLVSDTFPGEWGSEPISENAIKVIRTTNFTNEGYLDLTDVVTRDIEPKKVVRKKLKQGDTILERSGGTKDNPVGRVVFFDEIGDYLPNNFTQVLRPKESVNPVYLFYALYNSYNLNKAAMRAMASQTTGIQNLSMSDFMAKFIVLPSRNEQNKFEQIYRQADKSKFGDFKSQFIEMFGNCKSQGTLSSLCATFIDGDWIESKDQSDNGIRLIQTGNVGFGFFKGREDKSRYITEETFKKLNCTEVVPGDILISRLPDPIGRACIVPEGIGKAITAVDCTIVRLNATLLPEFLISFSKTALYASQINKIKTGTTRLRVSRGNLGNVIIPIPPIESQHHFAAIAQQADKSKSVIQKALVYLNDIQSDELGKIA